MDKFITQSPISKQIKKSAILSMNLPVNTLIIGEQGVGKKLLAQEILPNSTAFYAKELEQLIISKHIDLKEYSSIIIYHLEDVINIDEFLQHLTNIKIVATTNQKLTKYNTIFAVKIEIPPLSQRNEDLQKLIEIYTQEALNIYNLSKGDIDNTKLDLNGNGITLKQSIFKHIVLQSMSQKDILSILESYLYKQLQKNKTYKELLSIFEIPLLKASIKAFKSQLKISKQLAINRVTLRKKLHNYFGEL